MRHAGDDVRLHVRQQRLQALGALGRRARQARAQVAGADLGAHRQALDGGAVVGDEVDHAVAQLAPLRRGGKGRGGTVSLVAHE